MKRSALVVFDESEDSQELQDCRDRSKRQWIATIMVTAGDLAEGITK